MKRLWAASGFLTVIPLPAICRHTEEDLVRSVPFFPVVGLLIGLFAAGIAALLDGVFPSLVLSVVLVGGWPWHMGGSISTGSVIPPMVFSVLTAGTGFWRSCGTLTLASLAAWPSG